MKNNHSLSVADIKQYNRNLIIKELYNQKLSRSELAKKLGFSRAFISTSADEMIYSGILSETGNSKTNVYKKKLDINYNSKFVWGVSIDEDYIEVGLSNLNREVLGKKSENFKDYKLSSSIINQVAVMIDQLKTECGIYEKVFLGCGLCVHQSVVKQIDVHDLILEIQNSIKTNVVLTDITDAVCLHEYILKGGAANIVFINYEKDINTSCIINGGFFNFSKRLGIEHNISSKNGHKCHICGKSNCFNANISGRNIVDRINSIYSEQNTPNLYKSLGDAVESPGLKALLNVYWLNDEKVIEIIKDVSCVTGEFIYNIYNALMPSNIIIGGRLIENEVFLQALYDVLSKQLSNDIITVLDASEITCKTRFLAGCSAAINKYFVRFAD